MSKILLNGMRLVYGLLLIPAGILFLISGMLYDHPRAGGIFTNTFAFSVIALPFSLIFSIIASFSKPKFIWIAFFNIILFAIALLCIAIFQGGSFAPPR